MKITADCKKNGVRIIFPFSNLRKIILTPFFISVICVFSFAISAWAGQLEFDNVPVAITTTDNNDLVIAPGSGGNTQIGVGSGSNTYATSQNDLFITGVLEASGAAYLDSALTVTGALTANGNVTLGDSTSDTIDPKGIFSVTKNDATGDEVAYNLGATINKATSGNYTGLKLNITETSAPGTADKLMDLQVGGTSWLKVYNGVNSANYGLLSLGTGAWDGSTSGYFSGSSSGTLIAGNAASGFTGNLFDLQVAGVSKFKVAYDGVVTQTGSQVVTGNIAPSVDSTYNLGSTSAAWLNLYTDNIKTVSGTNLTILPTVGYTIIGDAGSPTYVSANDDLFVSGILEVAGVTYIKGATSSGLISFIGTDHAGLRANNLTTAQRDALTPAAGMAIFNTTVSKMQVYNGSSWKNVGNAEIGAEVTGGTAGSVLYVDASGNLGQNNANFYWDVSGTKLGIGTTVPGSKLGVLGAASIGATYGNIAAPTSGAIIEGSVGIGTTAPAYKLDVGGDIRATGNVYANNISPTGTSTFANLQVDGNTFLSTASGSVGIGTSIPGSKLGVLGAASIGATYATKAAPTSGAIIEGNVGIGNTLPGKTLDVTGTIRASDVITSTLADGTAPFSITSTTRVANLNVASAALADTVTTNANLTGAVTSVGNATSLGSFSSLNLSTALTDETGSGLAVFGTSPTLTTPALGVATGTSLALGGATIGSNALAATGSATISGNVGIGVTAPDAVLNLKAGTAAASTAPLKFTSGALNTTPEPGALEFLTDAYYGTITTAGARKQFAFTDSAMTSSTYVGTTAIPLNRASAAMSLTGITSIDGNAATVTTNANLTGPITSVGNATSVASQTGTGSKFVMDTSPTLVTPALGVASGTSLALGGATIGSNALAATGTAIISGNVGIGITNPSYPLDVKGSVRVGSPTIDHANANDVYVQGNLEIDATAYMDGPLVIGTSGVSTTGNFTTSKATGFNSFASNVGIGLTNPAYLLQLNADSAAKPSTNTWTVPSDKRIKKNISDFSDGLATVMKLKPRTYQYNGLGGAGYNDSGTHIGFIAQEVEPIAPYMIETRKGTIGGLEVSDFKTYQGHALPFILVNAIQEQQKEIAELKSEIEQLKAKVEK